MDNEGFCTEELLGSIFGHGAIPDILACDSEGRFCDIEREPSAGLPISAGPSSSSSMAASCLQCLSVGG